jgi:hypothetical protein
MPCVLTFAHMMKRNPANGNIKMHKVYQATGCERVHFKFVSIVSGHEPLNNVSIITLY